MRPVDKGLKPDKVFKKYNDASPILLKRIGKYCSYCEFPIVHVPEVEHVISKTKGGELLEWDNFLLSCKYCNTRKSDKVDIETRNDYLWPHKFNTFMAFTYEDGIPKVNVEFLQSQGDEILVKAQKLFTLIKLDNKQIGNSEQKDKRWEERLRVRSVAEISREQWIKIESADCESDEARMFKEFWLSQVLENAKLSVFFSIWMHVFHDIPSVKKQLIDTFIGTNKKCFDKDGNTIWWKRKMIKSRQSIHKLN